MTGKSVSTQTAQPPSLLAKVAAKYSVDADKMLSTLKSTAFKGDVNNEQMMALLIVADQYNLNPWTKEIYAFPDKNKGIVPVVGVDGWSRITNEHPQFDGMEFKQDDDSCTCIIFRKDRSHPVAVTEYMSECKRNTGPWNSHPKRMLRHKAMIQCARLAFGFVGFFDPDEAERIVYINKAGDMPKKAEGVTLEEMAERNRGDHETWADAGDTAPTMPSELPDEYIDVDTGEVNPAKAKEDPRKVTKSYVEFLIESADNKADLDKAVALIQELPEKQRSALRELALPLYQEFLGS